MRRFLLSNTLNTRDLGGYPTKCGGATSYKVFLRSDLPYDVSAEDVDLLLTNKITTIVDLRSDDEVQRKPCALKDNKDFKYYHSKLFGDGYLPKSTEEVPISYFKIVEEQNTILNTMKVLAKSNDGVLYHCTAGKDRTGVITALLLLLAGVSKADILYDYETSKLYLYSMLQEFCKGNSVDINIITPKREYMERFLELFHEKYNSVEEYFHLIGLSSDEIIELKGKLIGIKL